MSRPMRARGLKPEVADRKRKLAEVAPHAGAWIETVTELINPPLIRVAPHAGAWIETSN